MGAKEKRNFNKMIIIISIILLCLIAIYTKYMLGKETYAVNLDREYTKQGELENLKISNAATVDIEKIIQNNSSQKINTEEIFTREEELEYLTKYRNNDELYIGTTQVSQEGRKGIQTITMKKTFDATGKLLNEEQVSCIVTKASIDKIIDIGTKKYEEVPKNDSSNGSLSFDMALNVPSGFTMEEFKKVLTDSKDVNKIFQENSQYFYYIEHEYCINGIFVAALGIHESGWGTSKIAKNKYNLFGYGAYDSNPYNGAYSFSSYSEAIDLIARVLVKYYLNPAGTSIYDGETASGKYYSGNTLSCVNKKYATDKNWANAIFQHMTYLYNKK